MDQIELENNWTWSILVKWANLEIMVEITGTPALDCGSGDEFEALKFPDRWVTQILNNKQPEYVVTL